MSAVRVIKAFSIAALLSACTALTAPSHAEDALVIYSAGVDKILIDPKDQPLREALKLVSDRVLELPAELREQELPAPLIQLVLEMLQQPLSLRAGMMDNPPPNGPPFWAQFAVEAADEANAKSMADRLSAFIPAPTQPAEMPGMRMLDLDGVPGFLGATQIGGKPVFAFAVNKIEAAPLAFGDVHLPNGVSPTIFFKLDAKQLQPLFQMIMAQAGPDAAPMQMQLEALGLMGDNPSVITVASGYGADRAHSTIRMSNYKAVLEKLQINVAQGLTANDLKMIPADATYASLAKTDPKAIARFLREMAKNAPPPPGHDPAAGEFDPIEMIAKETGVHLEHDILDHLGQTYGYYMSDSTGGGGLLSMVAFIEAKNPQGLVDSIGRITTMINQRAHDATRGYVQFRTRKIDNLNVTSLMFPGVPIPLEISFAVAGNYLYAATSPQNLLVAVGQSKGQEKSLADNASFKEMGGDKAIGAWQVQFVDTPRLARAGYGLVSLGTAALSNAVRSPTNPDRDPGVVMPPFNQLMKNAKASVVTWRLEGDDFVGTGQGDRSALVQACGVIGALGGLQGVIAVGALTAGVMMPAMGKARGAAQDLRGMTQLRQIGTALIIYANDHNDVLPKSADELIEAGYIPSEMFSSPAGPTPDGKDFWIDTSGRKMSAITHPDRTIAAYDRAMFASGQPAINVLFFDGHVDKLGRGELLELMRDPANAATDFDLPGGGAG